MLKLLEEARLFKECTSQELLDISNVCQKISYKNGESIFKARSPAEYLYIVSEGAVELRFTVTLYQTSQEITIDRISKGEVFGWSALAKSHTYSLSAFVVKDSNLLRIKEKDLLKLCTATHHLGYILMKNIAEIISERFELFQKMLIDLIRKDLSEKEL